jgi:nucleoside-diphosphate-sugar epimerase
VALQASRVLVTGGAGLIGSHIVRRLLAEPVGEIVVLDNMVRGRRANLEQSMRDSRVVLIEGDIRDRALLARLLPGTELVLHQAALRITHCAQEPRLALEVLVDGTFNVLQAAVDAGVRKVVAASSASVYGLADRFPTAESHHPYNNLTLYGAAKVFNEGLLRSFRQMYGLDYVALRYFNVYGPGMDVEGIYTEVLVRWMEQIATEQSPVIFGDGAQTMDFVHVDDVARANILAAQADATDVVLNVASGRETSLAELARLLLNLMGSPLQPRHLPERGVNGVTRRLADVTAAERLLGFRTRIPLDEGLRELVRWWMAQRGSGLVPA